MYRINENERGAAMLEFAIVLPLLTLIILFGVVEVGSIIITKQRLTEIAKEGVRIAASERGLTPNPAGTAAGETPFSSDCSSRPRYTPPLNKSSSDSHYVVHSRACDLIWLNPSRGLDTQLAWVSSGFDKKNCVGAACTGTGSVSFRATVVHQSIIFGYDLFEISAERASSHLFP